MVASLRSVLESKPMHKLTEVIKSNISICRATRNLLPSYVVFARPTNSGERHNKHYSRHQSTVILDSKIAKLVKISTPRYNFISGDFLES
jgi:hypothetical protein